MSPVTSSTCGSCGTPSPGKASNSVIRSTGRGAPSSTAMAPWCSRAAASFLPMNPVPPVIRTRMEASSGQRQAVVAAQLADHGAVVEIAVAVLDQVGEEPVHEGGDRQLQPQPAGERQRRAGVLDLVLGRPAGLGSRGRSSAARAARGWSSGRSRRAAPRAPWPDRRRRARPGAGPRPRPRSCRRRSAGWPASRARRCRPAPPGWAGP